MLVSEASVAKPLTEAPEMTYAGMFYLNATEESAAVPVEGVAGSDLRGMDIRLSKVKSFRARGKVLGETPTPMILQLIPKGVPVSIGGRMATVQADKSFEFSGVTPGSYYVLAGTQGSTLISQQTVTVTEQHVQNLALSFAPMGDLTGTVTIEGDETASRSGIMIGFDSYVNGTNPSATLKEDGKFSVKIPLPDRFHPWIANQPGNTYVKSISYGGRDVKNDAVDLTDGINGPVEFVLTKGGADVRGVVTDADGKPVPGATVVFLPDGGEYLRHWSRNTDDKGSFHVPGMQPGAYKVLAWEDVMYLAWFDREFVKPFLARSLALTVRANDQKNLTLKVIPAADGARP
jgi:hypothetical protein